MLDKLRVKSKCFLKKYKLVNQFCKKCGKTMNYDFSVNDTEWNKISQYHNHVLCLDCFLKLYPEPEVNIKLYNMFENEGRK